MVFPQALGKSGLKPAFSLKSKVAVPKLQFWNSLELQRFSAEVVRKLQTEGLRFPDNPIIFFFPY
jgi:hypothetical protein